MSPELKSRTKVNTIDLTHLALHQSRFTIISLGDGCIVAWAGHLYSGNWTDTLKRLRDALGNSAQLAQVLRSIDGHFALAVASPTGGLAAVDRVRSIPLFRRGETIAARGSALTLECGSEDADPDAARQLAMAGYTIGPTTLYREVEQLDPGEAWVWGDGGRIERLRYDRYAAWDVDVAADESQLVRGFQDMTLGLFEKLVAGTRGRRIAVPLSAGLDSRLIVSALRHLGFRDVVCFSYGLPGNHEAAAAKRISRALGYPWHFVPLSPREQGRFWHTEHCRAYLKFADHLCNTPVVHDLPVVERLLADGTLAAGDIIINGNSGDYISGLHIHPDLLSVPKDASEDVLINSAVHAMVAKHFRLWNALATPVNDTTLAAALKREVPSAGRPFSAETIHGLYEYLELQNRQSKFVISRQRVYEFNDLDWRLPLWSPDYLNFWQPVPKLFKSHQTLYRKALTIANWGGVWQGQEWSFPRYVSPTWMRWGVRPLAKAMCVAAGRRGWHRVERRFLSYWMDLLGWQGIEPYARVAGDRRGARHFVSWHTAAYLTRHRLDWDGQPSGKRQAK